MALAAPATTPATGLTLTSASTVYTVDGTEDITYTSAPGGNNAEIKWGVVAGPGATGPLNDADGTCSAGTCAVDVGTDVGANTVRVWADNNDDEVMTGGEPSFDVQIVVAGPVATVELLPPSATTSTGTAGAVTFTATARDAAGTPVPGETLNIEVTQNVAAAGNPITVGGATGATGSGASPNWAVDATDATDPMGKFEFTVASASAGDLLVRVFGGGNATYDAGEPTDTSTLNVVAGGTEGITSLTIQTPTPTQYVSFKQVFTVTLTGAGGVPIAGETPSVDITAGPNAAVDPICAASNASGVSECEYNNGATAGTDTIVAWVNKLAGSTAGPDAGEPQASASLVNAVIPAYTDVTITCTEELAADNPGTQQTDCVVPLEKKSVQFTVTVKNNGTPVPGVVLNFPHWGWGGLGDVTVPDTAVTDANGQAVITATASAPTASGWIENDVHIGSPNVSGYAEYNWDARAAQAPVVTPMRQALAVGGSATVNVSVSDQFGTPVANQAVSFQALGRNATSVQNKSTDASGNVSFNYTDASAAVPPGTDNIWINGTDSNADVSWYANVAATLLTVDVTGVAPTVPPALPPAFGGEDTAEDVAIASSSWVNVLVENSAGDELSGKPVTFTVTGVGEIVGGGNTTTVLSESNGVARVQVTSTKSGLQTVTATVDGATKSGTLTYATPANTDARWITAHEDDADVTIAPGGTKNVRFIVTDRYGNPVPNVDVAFTATLPGYFIGGTNYQTGQTNSQGIANIVVSSQASASGGSTVTAQITEGGTQCTQPVNSPAAGLAAGNCSTVAEITWANAPVISGTVWRNGPGLVTLNVKVAPNAEAVLTEGETVLQTKTADASGNVQFLVPNVQKSTYLTVTADGASSTRFINIHIGTYMTLSSPAVGKVHARMDISPKAAGQEVRFWRYFPNGSRTLLGKAFTNANGVAQGTFNAPAGTTITVRAFVISKLDGLTNGFTKFKTVRIK